MNRNKKIVIGVLTFLPMIFYIWLIGFSFSLVSHGNTIINDANHDMNTPAGQALLNPLDSFRNFIVSTLLLFLVSIGLFIYYLVDTLSLNPKFKKSSNDKIIWVLVIFFGGFIGRIVYFFVEIVPRGQKEYAFTESSISENLN